MTGKYLNTAEVRDRLGNPSETTFWRYRNDPFYAPLNFPKPIRIGKLNRWPEDAIVEVQKRLEEGICRAAGKEGRGNG